VTYQIISNQQYETSFYLEFLQKNTSFKLTTKKLTFFTENLDLHIR